MSDTDIQNTIETLPMSEGHFGPVLPPTDLLPGEEVAMAFRQIALQSKTILTIDQAAELLHCAVSTLQTMPIDELPTYEGVGRYTLYLKSDLEDYVRSRRRVVKRGTGLVKRMSVIDHIPSSNVENPALEALKQL
ncbi:helix-turn-helix domain-containing protein [Lentilitoribacter sp. Alg239-R112]|uniref:helix-turn-helix domain-containing protein n=1 Tax=Lentilitoribacter sp. Alg239-R112 TaxID=2305987 RepID=UPI0013A6CCF1|nr:helix-turn-helix domain-containing protein [Lentilitoribacter sp. Alg239-R112]